MSFMKVIAPSLLFGIAVGTIFYIIGGVANPIFPAITPALAGAVGFTTATGITFLEESKKQ